MNDHAETETQGVSRPRFRLRERFDVLLGALVLLMLAAPFAHHIGPFAVEVGVPLLFTLILISATLAGKSRRVTVIAASLAAPTILFEGLGLFLAAEWLRIAEYVFGIAFLGFIIVVAFEYLFSSDRVTANTIFAALCVYLLLGILWAIVYSLVEVIDPGSFNFSFEDDLGAMRFGRDESAYALYYSFVTMTTLGYGEIVPATAPVRMLAALQAVMGQMYLAVLVARLVALHILHSSTGRGGQPEAM